MADSLAEIAYSEATRGLDEQSAALREVRSRSGTLLAAASLVTAFLGADFVEPISAAEWLAIAFFLVAASCSVLILLSGDWQFHTGPRALFEEVEKAGTTSLEDAYKQLALQLDTAHDTNERHLTQLHWLLRGATTFLALEVGAWIWALA